MEVKALFRLATTASLLAVLALACGQAGSANGSQVSVQDPVARWLDPGHTQYGFFPAPPRDGVDAVLEHFQALGQYADFILIQAPVPWQDFLPSIEGDSQSRIDLRNQVILAGQHGLGVVFVVDPLNGLDRREFFGLPQGWEGSFANLDVRASFRHFTLWLLRTFRPQYLGLASEINTYGDAHPEDMPHFHSLYQETYAQVKAESPDTLVFVTFQWEGLTQRFPEVFEGGTTGLPKWEQVQAFEPNLDIWAISTYPYFIFSGGEPIPPDYYTPLADQTAKPLAVAEGGYASRLVGNLTGSTEAQVQFLESVQNQIGNRLRLWVNLLLTDFDLDAYRQAARAQGRDPGDLDGLAWFAGVGLRENDGRPKPALELWASFLHRPQTHEGD